VTPPSECHGAHEFTCKSLISLKKVLLKIKSIQRKARGIRLEASYTVP